MGFLRYLASIAHLQEIFYLWRPWLSDPNDDMLLELAVAARARYIITFNIKDFSRTQSFGITAINPKDFLNLIKQLPPP